MNFRILFLILIITSCGLKKYPKAPKDTQLPEITDQYKFKSKEIKKEDKKEKKK